MAEFFLIRHGQTIWNNSRKYQGHTDIPLSEEGRKQAQKLRDKLANKEIHAFYSSDLSRALETAQIVAEFFNKEVKVLPQLREINFGCWEGLTYEEVMEKYGEVATAWYNDPQSVCIPGGESCEEVKKRAFAVLNSLAKKHQEETVAIVSHGGTIRLLIMAALGWDMSCFWHLRLDNTALSILEINDGYASLKLFNDTCHLEEDRAVS